MKQYLFPAVFIKNEDEYIAVFPDLNIQTEGDTIEEAYLFAKDYLRVYCTYTLKFDIELDYPSKFEAIQEKHPNDLVMLVDTMIDPKKI